MILRNAMAMALFNNQVQLNPAKEYGGCREIASNSQNNRKRSGITKS